MASRIIQIEVRGEAGQYEATVNRIIDKNNQLNRAAVEGAQKTTSAFGDLQKILIRLPSFFGGIASGIAGAFSVGAIAGFIKSVVSVAGQIDDLSKKTGFSRQTLSGLKSIIEENGSSLDAFATAITKAQKSLADVEGDGKKAAQALAAMGLNVNQLVKDSPEKFMETFAEALSKVEGQNQRVAIATRVMGKAGADQIPVLLELVDKFRKLRNEGASPETIKALDAVGDAFVRNKNKMVIAAQEGIVDLLRFFGVIRDSAKVAAEIESATTAAARVFNLPKGRIEGMTSKEIIAAAEAVPQGIKRSAIEARDALLNAREEFDRLSKAEQEKPPTNIGGGLPNIDEGAIKRQTEALEQAKTKLMQLKLAAAEAARADGDLTVNVRELAVALIEQERAAAESAAKGNKSYTDQLGKVLQAEKDAKIAAFDASEALKERNKYIEQANKGLEVEADLAKETADAWGFYAKYLEDVNKKELEHIDLEKQLGDLEADRLVIIGQSAAADKLRIENRIKQLRALQEQDKNDADKVKIRAKEIENEQARLQQLGTVTINVGQTIANSVGDAFEGVILGTRKLADVGKGLMSALIRDIGSFFSQALLKKLGFENLLLNNTSGFLPQLAGLFDTGSGSSGVLSNIAGLFSSFFGSGGPVQLSGPGATGTAAAALSQGQGGAGGGFGFGQIGSIFSAISTVWSLLPETLTTAITTMATTVTTTIATSLTAVLDSITAALSNPITWIAALVVAAITAIYRIVANQQERPNVKLSAMFEGVAFDPTSQQFIPGDINVAIGRKVGIKNSQAGQIADNLQKRLVVLADQWVGILNIFPDFIAEDIQPALDETNRRLNYNFRNLKLSPGGSRSIQEELESISGPAGLFRFLQAFQPAIEQGFRSSLQRGGIQIGSAAGFANIDPNRGTRWGAPQKDWDEFIKAIGDVAALTGQLGKTGAGKFLTGSDISGVTSLFDQLFSITDSATFVKAAAEIQEKLKPALDFIQQSMQEATDLFGRGLIAAMEAATESDAQIAFLDNLGKGIKDKIFSGIVESFTASAQFADLLAPIQQTIRDFAQQALTTGVAPDLGAFRAALFPEVEAISARASTLAPLISELQKLGFDIRDSLGLIVEQKAAEPVPAVQEPTPRVAVEINIENYTREDDPAVLARRIGELLSGKLAPA